MKRLNSSLFLLRIALAATFLSAVSSRFPYFGNSSDTWQNFIEYAEEVNLFAPKATVPFLATTATTLEIVFALLLVVGYKIKHTAIGASILTLMFALAMTYSYGIKEPLDYSVFVFSAASLVLSQIKPDSRSLDSFLENRNIKNN